MPPGPRALDHLVLPTRDLDALAGAFADLGFQVGSRNRHPWGTENHIIQVPGAFLELIGLAPDYRSVSADNPAAPFAGFVEDVLRTRADGIAMLVLRSADARADAATFVRRGIGHGAVLPFSRTSVAVDRERIVAFTIAFATAPRMPAVGVFTCEQHRPENFWSEAQQVHPNGASAFGGIVMVATRPDDHAGFLTAFGDPARIETIEGGLRFVQDGSAIDVVTPRAFETRYGKAIDLGGDAARIAAVSIVVTDIGAVPSSSESGDHRGERRRLLRPGGGDILLIVTEGPAADHP